MHDEHRAEELVTKAFKILEIDDTGLSVMKKSDPRKQAIAWLLKQKTSVSNVWIANRLCMGHYTAVNNAVYALHQGKKRNIKKLRRKIEDLLTLED